MGGYEDYLREQVGDRWRPTAPRPRPPPPPSRPGEARVTRPPRARKSPKAGEVAALVEANMERVLRRQFPPQGPTDLSERKTSGLRSPRGVGPIPLHSKATGRQSV
ncbi:hypothetical protein XENOCAPTIV_001446 [Xenoophorus captivus]|uniref:Uncharacterized protein n=1 Tax=Xenoophorus captivus TaxID=1517983 RepID=A0ABV0S4P2_9TELE